LRELTNIVRDLNYTGEIVSMDVYDDNIIYRVKLDNDLEIKYIDFRSAVAVHKINQKSVLKDWSVKDGYIYTLLYPGNGYEVLSRVKVNSSSDPHIFWKIPMK
jgi:hypothetical protein